MHKQTEKKDLLKICEVDTHLHQGSVFGTYKPNKEKAKQNSVFRGAQAWNSLMEKDRNRVF